jgi:hypothetical protein
MMPGRVHDATLNEVLFGFHLLLRTSYSHTYIHKLPCPEKLLACIMPALISDFVWQAQAPVDPVITRLELESQAWKTLDPTRSHH